MHTEQVAQNRLCMDKGDFAGEFAKISVCPQSQVLSQSVWERKGAREAQRNAHVLTVKVLFDLTRFKTYRALLKMN